MPRKPSRPPVACEFFTWRLFERDGVFYADGRNRKYNLGKHSLATRDVEEAIANLRKLDRQKAVQLGLASPATTSSPAELSLREGWEKFLGHCERGQVLGGVGPRTLKRYRAVRDKHLAFCDQRGIRLWTEVDRNATEKYGNLLTKRDYADRSIYLELTLIKSVIGWLVEEGYLPPSCSFRLPLRKPEGTDTYCYTQDQVAAMVHHCQVRPELFWLAEVIVGLVCSGLRIGELATLRWSDVDFRSMTILLTDERASSQRKKIGQLRTIKGRKNRALPIHPELVHILQGMKRHPDGRIFHGPRGGALKPDTVRNIFVREVIEGLKEKFPTPPGEIGFAHGRLHSFRHYFCSQAFLGGAAEADLRQWLGHRDSKMVDHYRHLRREDSQRKMNQIDFLGRDGRTGRSSG